jgi:2'-hydroxyisoflavone reductase
MRLLVLGGSVFLSQTVAGEAVRRGHDVVCACRGVSGTIPPGAVQVSWDRNDPVPMELEQVADTFDAVVDVARTPSWVSAAVAAFPAAHWVFVSTINVYADTTVAGGAPNTLPLVDPEPQDIDLGERPDAYGPMKVACEKTVLQGSESSTIIRPGLICGPGDPSGRFTYWPWRLSAGGEVLAPGDPGDRVQIIDVRDLAAWIVRCAETRTVGVFDGVGPVTPLGEVLAEVAHGVGSEPRLRWVSQDFLESEGVPPWSGEGSLPLWLPRPEYDGMLAHDPEPSYRAGLSIRPIADTARDTLAWFTAYPDATVTGMDRERERELLEAWHAGRGDTPE